MEAIRRTMVIHMPRIRTTAIRHMDIIDRINKFKKRLETNNRFPGIFFTFYSLVPVLLVQQLRQDHRPL
jgi:hypothetical protein